MDCERLNSPVLSFVDINGKPLVGGKLYIYDSGTDTPATTYRNIEGTDANENPIILNGRGECVCFLDSSKVYKVMLKDSEDGIIWEQDPVVPNDLGNVSREIISQQQAINELNSSKMDKRRNATEGNFVSFDYDGNSEDSGYGPTDFYQEPEGGIPKTDLAQGVQDSLDLADTSLQPGDLNSAILEWDGSSRLYDQIKELEDAGKIVFIKKDQFYYAPVEGLPSGRFCFVSMPTYYVVFYLEFYPNAHPTGFNETTKIISTVSKIEASSPDSYIWETASNNASIGITIFEDSNYNRYIAGKFGPGYSITFYAENPENGILAYVFERTGTPGNYTYTRTTISAKVYPVITNVKTSSTYNDPKVVRVCLCYLDRFADDSNHTAQQGEFEIQCTTGATTPNGNANSSFSMRVLVTARDNGGPIKVDCRITGNNGWDFVNAEPTISAYDTNNGNGVIVFFGLMKNGVWQDFEETYVTLVNMKPDVETKGTTDSVKSYADPIWHPETENTVWGHFENTTYWTTISTTSEYELQIYDMTEGAVGSVTNNRINLPAGLYRFSLELAYTRSSSNGTTSPYYGHESYHLRIYYGASVLRAQTFTFNGMPSGLHITQWCGGVFKMSNDGELIIKAAQFAGVSVDGNSKLKVSHVFINRIA